MWPHFQRAMRIPAGAGLALGIILALGARLARAARAYEFPMQSETIREACLLGNRNDEIMAETLAQYARHFPPPKDGPYISDVRLETPFVQIVEKTRQRGSYNPPDAVQDYLGKPAVFRIVVDISFTQSFGAYTTNEVGETVPRSDDFWRHFQLLLVQNKQVRQADVERGQPIEACGRDDGGCSWTGEEVTAEINARKIESAPLKIKVIAPDGSIAEAKFDLTRLR